MRSDNPAKRFLRAQCANVSEAQARAWLTEYAHVITIVTSRFKKTVLYARGFDFDDLQPIAQMAVLEACTTFNESAGGTLRTWVGSVLRWRLAESIERATDRVLPVTAWIENPDSHETLSGHHYVEELIDTRSELLEYAEMLEAGETDAYTLAGAFELDPSPMLIAAIAEELKPPRKKPVQPRRRVAQAVETGTDTEDEPVAATG